MKKFIRILKLIWYAPNMLLISITTLFVMVRQYRKDLMADPNNANLSRKEITVIALHKIIDNRAEHRSYIQFIEKQAGYATHLVSIVFWLSIYNLIFN